ncbi:DUF2809 domain-containing protein [Halioxenophilus aromaticivorans]|uniref:DUF2809 domain-containing protein n=1 Tax=Halioxenophilus aromaticivorans TaxID=1306992 RepID=A0AAV3TZ29_9ALTE
MTNRFSIALCLVFVITLGLASRKFHWLLPELLGYYPGDALWAAAAYMAWKLLLPKSDIISLAAAAVLTSYAVEFSQLYQADWINHIRNYRLGHLLLGARFNQWDLIAYLAGVLMITITDYLILISKR